MPLNIKSVPPIFVNIKLLGDLSYHLANVEFDAGGVPVARGSAPSNHKLRPLISLGKKGALYRNIFPESLLI